MTISERPIWEQCGKNALTPIHMQGEKDRQWPKSSTARSKGTGSPALPAFQGVEHDDMNVLVLGARVIGPAMAQELVATYISAKFTNEERHLRRLNKVKALEQRFGT